MRPAWRGLPVALVLLAPACVIRLADRNAPAVNGAVTGEPANCSGVTPEPRGAPGGDAEVLFVGRFDRRDENQAIFDWSGNYVAARFEGSSVRVRLTALEADAIFWAVVDDLPPVRIHVESAIAQPEGKAPPGVYTIATGLRGGPHDVVVHRNTEAQSGPTVFGGFEIDGTLLPPVRRPRRIEVIGDSITCGYGNEGANATCPFDVEVRRKGNCPEVITPTTNLDRDWPTCEVARVPATENQYLAYSSIAARELDADVVTICWSGKGVEKNYRERSIDPNRLVTLPQMWRERTLAGRANVETPDGVSGVAWDFASEPEPQVVVINLGTNDFTRDVAKNNEGFAYDGDNGDNLPDGTIYQPGGLESYERTFREFVAEVRTRRPNAHIFLAVPPMLTDQYPLDDARATHKRVLLSIVDSFTKSGDSKVYAMELVEQGVRYGLGCDYHPNLITHQIMAKQLVGAIRSKTCW